MTKRSSIVAAKNGTYWVRDRSRRVIAVCKTFDEAWLVQSEYLGYVPRGTSGAVL